MRRPGPHQELTDPENEKVLGTLTHRAWWKLNAKRVKARFYSLDNYDLELLDVIDVETQKPVINNPSEDLYHEAIQTSGSIQGKHREDLTKAIVGAQPQVAGVALPMQQSSDSSAKATPKKGL